VGSGGFCEKEMANFDDASVEGKIGDLQGHVGKKSY
jgi:hypothetical protein